MTTLTRRHLLVGALSAGFKDALAASGSAGTRMLEEIQQAHRGHQPLATLSFGAREQFRWGSHRFLYPELGAQFTTYNRYDFVHHTAWQRAVHGPDVWDWWWTPSHGTVVHINGSPTVLRVGLERGFHLRAFLFFLAPWDAVHPGSVQLTARGPHSLHVRFVSGHQDQMVFSRDPDTGLLQSVRYSVHELGLPQVVEARFEDMRQVAGAWLPHRFVEGLATPLGLACFHTMDSWAVRVSRSMLHRPHG